MYCNIVPTAGSGRGSYLVLKIGFKEQIYTKLFSSLSFLFQKALYFVTISYGISQETDISH